MPGSFHSRQCRAAGSYTASLPANHSVIHRRPRESLHTRRAPPPCVGVSSGVSLPLAPSARPSQLPASEATQTSPAGVVAMP